MSKQVLTVKATVKIPTVPNFILGADGDMKFPLSAFDDAGLKLIAQAWTVELLNNANRQRVELCKSGGEGTTKEKA